MVGGLKIIRVKQGHEADLETLFRQLRAEMHKAEPGCLLYSLLKSRSDPQSYIVHEQYRDAASLEAHQASAHGKSYFPRMRAILESITIEYFDVIVE